MDLDAISPSTVHNALRAIRAARTLADSPLLQLRAVVEGLRAERVSDSPSARSAFLQTWLEGIARDELAGLRGTDEAPGGRRSSAADAFTTLQKDFRANSVDREAWGALHFHYFSGTDVKLREVASALGLGYNTVRRRIERGYQLLAAQVLAKERAAGAAAAIGRTVPRPLTRFIGRERELAAIRERMAHHRLVTLTGPGGIGKSRLAIRLASDLALDYPDGVSFVDLAEEGDERHVPSAFIFALGLREAPGGRPVDQMIRFLADLALLLVVDNCEHVVGASSALLRSLLEGTSRLRVLATSREELLVDGQAAWAVPPMSIPPADVPVTATSLLHYDATRLFVARASAAAGRTLTESEAAQAVRIADHLEGIPLAIELAAARTRVLSLDQIETRLADRFALLKDGRQSARPAHATLWEAIDWSYELLTAAEQVLFRRLSAFRGGWSLEAAEAVCAGDGLARSDILTLLSQLTAKSLVSRIDDDAEPRFGMLETLRQFAEAKGAAGGESPYVWSNHLTFFADLAVSAEREWDGPDEDRWWRRLRRDDANLEVAMERASAGIRLVDGLRMGAALERYWIRGGQVPRGRRILDDLACSAVDLSSLEHARVLCAAGMLALVNLDRPAMADYAQRSQTMAEIHRDAKTLARANMIASIARFELGEREEAIVDLRATADRARALGDRSLLARCLSSLARFSEQQGGPSATMVEAWRAVVEAAEGGAVRDVWINAHERLAGHAFAAGDLKRAADHVAISLAACREDDWSPVVGMAHRTAGNLELSRGAFDRARPHFETALFIGRRSGQPALASSAVMYLGELDAETGELQRARERATEAVQLATAGGAVQSAFRAYELLFRLEVVAGDIEAARAHLTDMARLKETHAGADSGEMMRVHRMTMARVEGDLGGAAALVAAALRAAQAEREEWGTIDVLWEAALLAVDLDRPASAARLASAIGTHCERIGWSLDWFERLLVHQIESAAWAVLGDEGAADARRDGSALSFQDAVALALKEVTSGYGAEGHHGGDSGG